MNIPVSIRLRKFSFARKGVWVTLLPCHNGAVFDFFSQPNILLYETFFYRWAHVAAKCGSTLPGLLRQ